MMLLGWAGCVPWALVVIPLIDTGNRTLYAIAIVGMCADRRDRFRSDRVRSSPSCSPPVTATADRRWRSTWPASSAVPCRR